jgi:ATP-dependent Clp protease protease subunit
MEESQEHDESGVLQLPWGPGTIVHFGAQSRTLSFVGEVDDELVVGFISQLNELISIDQEAPIFILINTPGGDAVGAWAVHDYIKACPVPVCAIVAGGCMSAGLIVLSACDYRISTPNSLFFYHQCLLRELDIASEPEIDSKVKMYKLINQKNDDLIRTRAGISKAVWKRDFLGSTSKYLSAQEAIEYNLIDGIIEPMTKKAGLKEFIASLGGE